MKCPTCLGEGTVKPVIEFDGREAIWEETCGTCKGTGEAPDGSKRDLIQLHPQAPIRSRLVGTYFEYVNDKQLMSIDGKLVLTKLWHDDVRRPPDETWLWARTNEEAIKILRVGGVTEISLDHDLGLEAVDPDEQGAYRRPGHSPNGTGADLARWMCDHQLVPENISVHSWSRDGVEAIVAVFKERGIDVAVAPYQHRYAEGREDSGR